MDDYNDPSQSVEDHATAPRQYSRHVTHNDEAERTDTQMTPRSNEFKPAFEDEEDKVSSVRKSIDDTRFEMVIVANPEPSPRLEDRSATIRSEQFQVQEVERKSASDLSDTMQVRRPEEDKPIIFQNDVNEVTLQASGSYAQIEERSVVNAPNEPS